MIKPLAVFLCLAAAPQVLAQAPTAYVNAHIFPVSGAPIDNGTVLIANGKITACGARVTIPSGATRIDLHGAVLIPGLVDASSSLFLSAETLAGGGTADQNVLDGLDPFDRDALKVLSRGVTTVYVSPGSRGGVGGLGAVVKLQDAATGLTKTGAAVLETTLKARAGVQLALGLSAGGRSSSLDRASSYQNLRTMFVGAQQYAKQQDKAAKEKAAAEKKPAPAPTQASEGQGISPETNSVDFDAAAQRRQFPRGGAPGRAPQTAAPRAQPAQEVLAAALKGEIPVRIEAHRVDDILNALRLADEFKFKLILEAPSEAKGALAEIVAHKAAVLWTPTRPVGVPTLETADFSSESVAELSKAGVRLAISGRSASGVASRFLLENAGLAAGSGLSSEAALKAVTLGAADLLGVSDRVGSIQPGKDADLVVLSGSPWSASTVVKRVIVNGVQVYGAP